MHKNPGLSKIDKFNYLNSLLEGRALRAIQGLTSLLRRGFKDCLVSSNANALDDKHFSSNAGDPMRGRGDNEIPHK